MYTQNGNQSKVDVFQQRNVLVTAQVAEDGSARVTQQMTVTNATPAERPEGPPERVGYETSWLKAAYILYVPDDAVNYSASYPTGFAVRPFKNHPQLGRGWVDDGFGHRMIRVVGWTSPGGQNAVSVSATTSRRARSPPTVASSPTAAGRAAVAVEPVHPDCPGDRARRVDARAASRHGGEGLHRYRQCGAVRARRRAPALRACVVTRLTTILAAVAAVVAVLLWVLPPVGLVAALALLAIVPPWGRSLTERAVISGIVLLGVVAIVFPRAGATPVTSTTARLLLVGAARRGARTAAGPAPARRRASRARR